MRTIRVECQNGYRSAKEDENDCAFRAEEVLTTKRTRNPPSLTKIRSASSPVELLRRGSKKAPVLFDAPLCIRFHCRLAGLTCVLDRLEQDSADIREEPSLQARRIEIEEMGLRLQFDQKCLKRRSPDPLGLVKVLS
jgi:hypothetical protein